MKITLFSVLSILSSLSLQAQTYMAEGVDKDNIMNSTHFYDSGKGEFWTNTSGQPNIGLKDALDGSITVENLMGDLSGSIYSFLYNNTYYSDTLVSLLRSDVDSCWYQAGANAIEYWQSYYGVFASRADAPSGYTYDKQYVDDFAGTQSLDLGYLFYQTFQNKEESNFGKLASWYFANNDTGLPFQSGASEEGGYYEEHYKSESAYTSNEYNYLDSKRTETLAEVTERLVDAMGYGYVGGELQKVKDGQLAVLGVSREDVAKGHVITCYGFELDENGELKSIIIADSDDLKYGTTTLYIQQSTENVQRFELFTDEGCTEKWVWGGSTEYVLNSIYNINTSTTLDQLYESYSAQDNALVWSGGSGEWGGTDSTDDGGVATFNSGWVRYATTDADETMNGYFYSKDEQGRHVTFNDYVDKAGSATTSRSVSLAKDVQAPSVLIDNSSIAYTFEGNGNKLTADSITKQGSDTATFRDTVLQVTDIQVKEGRFAMENTQLSGSMTVSGSGELYVVGETSSIQSGLTLRTGASLEFSSTGDILTVNGDLSIESGFRSQGSVIGTLILKDGALLITSKGDLARAMSVSETALLSSRSAESALLNANLDLTAASGITTDGSALALGGTLMLSSERMLTLDFSTTPLLDGSNQLMIFTDLAGITVDGEATTNYLQFLTLSDSAQAALGQDATLKYDEATGELYVELANVPEPSTATLSLLALAGLMARRRRRC